MNKAIPTSAQIQWVEIAAGKKRKLKKLTPRDELDRAIDWYEKYKPDMPRTMPGGVAMTALEIEKFASKTADGVYSYRGWRLELSDAPNRKDKPTKIRK